MPELPDIDVYIDVLVRKLQDKRLENIRLGNPFLLRSVEPPVSELRSRRLLDIRRIGKRIAFGFEGDIWAVLHLMIAGRLHWSDKAPSLGTRNALAAFDFENGSLLLTESGTKKRASLYVVEGESGLCEHDPGGIEPLECGIDEFRSALERENHTLKRSLTDPRIFSGIGNAYSDEILHMAKLSPVKLSKRLTDKAARRLFDATVTTLGNWRQRLLDDAAGKMPAKVTAFRDGMRVHGRFGKPCPECGEPIQRIRYKRNESNYCARCQTDSRILRDRSLSRLLKQDWPETLDDLHAL
jgi:formamidopyrimidine-DNA glycosylase